MYVVHDVVDDYPDLASFAVGDLEERHVVVYRRGFQPEGKKSNQISKSNHKKVKVFDTIYYFEILN